MKILITGSNGLLGQKIVLDLIAKPSIETIATSLGENRMPHTNGYSYQSLDITNPTQIDAAINQFQPDAIIHTAAMTNVDACESQRESCWAQNVDSISYFIKSIENFSNKEGKRIHFIHLSTDFIFDGENGPYDELAKPNPLSYYALSKNESEKLLINSSIKWSILRTAIVYGIVNRMSRTNIVLWAKDSLSKGNKINVVDDQFRSPTLAEDLAQGCILTAIQGKEGIFNISGKNIMSVLELVYAVADFWKLDKTLVTPIKSATLNQAAKRPPRTGFILDKARKELGYEPHSFMEGLAILDKQLSDSN
ncbi:MAG TPA: NAD(P)-dependent oxidoreductase [Bacteroidia bacterium]|nr:NAD(P)-dependent oxidoreductase [Bacteroidia bacterium]HRH07676.1 NAD(P)-dependent oxidoreductase [Bacteroidia bacterium]HRH63619.1 NAD(P)-dependent oxidoreductase [Bacteroidia bacterium]